MKGLLFALAAVLLAVWIVGFVFKYIVSPLIHIALLAALVLFVYQLVARRNRHSVS